MNASRWSRRQGFMMTSSIGMEKFTMRDTEVGVMDDREFEKKR